jgi:hypothetical protein
MLSSPRLANAGPRAQTPNPSSREEHHQPGAGRSTPVRHRVTATPPTGIVEQRVSPGLGSHPMTPKTITTASIARMTSTVIALGAHAQDVVVTLDGRHG